jgi:hypothetical protein
LQEHGISLDFSKKCFHLNVKKTTKVKSTRTLVVDPNSECVIQGVLDDRVGIGMQGVLVGHPELAHKGVLVSKALVTCLLDHLVCVMILNPGNEIVHIQKGTFFS